jgi:hypothetical protein
MRTDIIATHQIVTIGSRYSDRTTTVRARRYPDGRCYISAGQIRAAKRRLRLMTGDYLEGVDGTPDSQGDYAVSEVVA